MTDISTGNDNEERTAAYLYHGELFPESRLKFTFDWLVDDIARSLSISIRSFGIAGLSVFLVFVIWFGAQSLDSRQGYIFWGRTPFANHKVWSIRGERHVFVSWVGVERVFVMDPLTGLFESSE